MRKGCEGVGVFAYLAGARGELRWAICTEGACFELNNSWRSRVVEVQVPSIGMTKT